MHTATTMEYFLEILSAIHPWFSAPRWRMMTSACAHCWWPEATRVTTDECAEFDHCSHETLPEAGAGRSLGHARKLFKELIHHEDNRYDTLATTVRNVVLRRVKSQRINERDALIAK